LQKVFQRAAYNLLKHFLFLIRKQKKQRLFSKATQPAFINDSGGIVSAIYFFQLNPSGGINLAWHKV